MHPQHSVLIAMAAPGSICLSKLAIEKVGNETKATSQAPC